MKVALVRRDRNRNVLHQCPLVRHQLISASYGGSETAFHGAYGLWLLSGFGRGQHSGDSLPRGVSAPEPSFQLKHISREYSIA
jgi:hypothetical protein